jgi:hypothetical protein
MDRIGVFHYSFKRSPIIMETCGNVSLLRINVNVLLRQEGKFGMENKYFRIKIFYVFLKNNQRICINPHIQIIFSYGGLVRATNFSICQNNKKGKDPSKKLDFTDVVYKKVLKMEIFNSIFVDMVFNNLEFVSLLRKKLTIFAMISSCYFTSFQKIRFHFLLRTRRKCSMMLSPITEVM